MDDRTKILFNWGISDTTGWGIYGLNLLIHGHKHFKYDLRGINKAQFLYPLDPFASKIVSEKTNSSPPIVLKQDDIFLAALGADLQSPTHNKYRHIGVIFHESNPLSEEHVAHLNKFEFIIAGSTWGASILEKCGIKTKTIIQGVDLDLFRWTPKKYFKDKFVVFSGGKLEYRKGQDILIKAFSIFASRHSDVVLVTAWRSYWENTVFGSINRSGVCEPLLPSKDVKQSIYDWTVRNKINPQQVIHLDVVPNRLMPEVFREVDLAVFPNRCEAGTNLVAMEALAFGLPCLISKNTGHLDIIKSNNCIPLTEQRAIPKEGRMDWGESSIDEIVDLMEAAYQGKLKLDITKARKSMEEHSWENSIDSMFELF
jgi:glycosyltransferase involved in cell wall biosynthesis